MSFLEFRSRSTVALLHPAFTEGGVLHAFALAAVECLGDEVAIDRMDRPVASLDHARIVVGAIVMIFQMTGSFPGLSLVVGDRDSQRVPSARPVVVNETEVAVCQSDAVDTSAWIGQLRQRHWSP